VANSAVSPDNTVMSHCRKRQDMLLITSFGADAERPSDQQRTSQNNCTNVLGPVHL